MHLLPIAGHTLGTPHLTPPEAIRLFAAAGLDAAELIWQNDYLGGIPENDNGRLLADVAAASAETGLPVIALTPYMSGINSPDETERIRDVERFAACITDAERLGARLVRVYAGAYTPDQVDERAQRWELLVQSLTQLAPIADAAGVTLVVENHFNTMTMSAQETVELVHAVDHPAVGILYDQANLTFTHCEPWEIAQPLQRGFVRHVHAKDLVFVDRERQFSASSVATVAGEERAVRSRVLGEGEIDWAGIIQRLLADGYDGAISLEYEYRWHPQDLAPPLEGFRRGAERLRDLLSSNISTAGSREQ